MSRLTEICLSAVVAVSISASAAAAETKLNGTVAIGGIVLDETGDRATTVETYNVFDGFSISQLRLTGSFNPKSYFSLNLREVNLDSRKGEFVYRLTDRLRVTSSYDQWRQIYDPEASITSDRKDWRTGLRLDTGRGGVLTANYNLQNKTGDRTSYPDSTFGVLGDGYDYTLQTGMIQGEGRNHGVGFAAAYNFADYNDKMSPSTNRFGQILSARLYTSKLLWPDKLTNMFRAAWGKQELTDTKLNYTLWQFQYTGVVRPHQSVQFKYNFDYSRIDDEGTTYITDAIRNNFDLTYYSKYGQVYGAYGYETNDDNIALTHYNTFLFGASANYEKKIRMVFEYGSRLKDDEGKTTLLEDIDTDKLLVKIRAQIIDPLYAGGKIQARQREYTTIGVQAKGQIFNVYAGYDYMGWGSLYADYTYSDDNYDDLDGGFETNSNIATARLQIDRIKGLTLVGGTTYLDIGNDLDIEKSILFFEGKYMLPKDLFVEAKYNVYNYDDYIVTSRYYTANVVWFNVGYNFKKD